MLGCFWERFRHALLSPHGASKSKATDSKDVHFTYFTYFILNPIQHFAEDHLHLVQGFQCSILGWIESMEVIWVEPFLYNQAMAINKKPMASTTLGPETDHKSGRILRRMLLISRHHILAPIPRPSRVMAIPGQRQANAQHAQRQSAAATWLWQRHCWRRRFCCNSAASSLHWPLPLADSNDLDGRFGRPS